MSTDTTEHPQDLWFSLLGTLENDGILLPAQTDLIRRIAHGTGQEVDMLLLGSGLISERTLQSYLQKMFGVNTVYDPFDFPSPEACSLLTEAEVMQLNAIPQKIDAGSVIVLVVPPLDPGQLEWIRARTQKFVIPLLATPLRFHYILNQCFNVPIDEQEKKTAEKVLENLRPARERFRAPVELLYDPFSGPVGDITEAEDPLELSRLPIPDRTIEVLDVFREELASLIENDLPTYIRDTASTVLPEEAIEQVGSLASRQLDVAYTRLEPSELEEMAARIENREQLPEMFYRFGARAMRSVALFTCTEGFAMGWTGAGLGLFPHRLEGIIAPEDRGTIISDVIQNKLFMGKPEKSAVNRRILQLMGADPEDILVGGTVFVKERPVIVAICVLDDEVAGAEELRFLGELCQVCASIILRLVRQKKSS